MTEPEDVSNNPVELAMACGAVSFTPPPLRAVRGVSFTFEQLATFVERVRGVHCNWCNFPRVHSYDVSPDRDEVVIQWDEDKWLPYTLDHTAYTDEPEVIAKINRLAALPEQAGGVSVSIGRTAEQYAIEHAEYLAKGAEQLLTALNDEDEAHVALNSLDTDDDDYLSADERHSAAIATRCEFAEGLRSDIYEFRKRAKRATQPTTLNGLTEQETGATASVSGLTKALTIDENSPYWNLQVVITVIENGDPFDATCLATLKRVAAQLATGKQGAKG